MAAKLGAGAGPRFRTWSLEGSNAADYTTPAQNRHFVVNELATLSCNCAAKLWSGMLDFNQRSFGPRPNGLAGFPNPRKLKRPRKDLSLGAAFYRHRVFKVSIDEGRPLWVITRDPVPRLLRGLCAFVMDACSHLL